jgi:hypothetical protein
VSLGTSCRGEPEQAEMITGMIFTQFLSDLIEGSGNFTLDVFHKKKAKKCENHHRYFDFYDLNKHFHLVTLSL